MIATAPGKLILTGEYAVLDGAPALVVAVDRRVTARVAPPDGSSPFLSAVAAELRERRGAADPTVARAAQIVVDSAAFFDGSQKLGLGSSAAVTVAATALALGAPLDREEVLTIALAAHANAQGTRGARGSGADVAAAVYGGALVFAMGRAPAPLAWPAGLALVPFFTGVSADTATLVDAVAAARAARPPRVEAALAQITEASHAVAAAATIAAFARAGAAMDQLAEATGLPLVPACVRAARAALERLGGTAKTTGAGGGDIGVAIVPAAGEIAVTDVTSALIEAGCQPLRIHVDKQGVDLRADAQ